MRSRKSKKLSSFIQAGIVIASIVVSAFSILTTILPMPQVKNPLIGMAIGYILLLAFSFWKIYEMQLRIKELESEREWVEVDLELIPQVAEEQEMTLDDMWNITTAYFEVFNRESLPITDCYVTLEKAEICPSQKTKSFMVFSDVYLSWKGNVNNSHFVVIPSKNETPKIANLWRKERATEKFTFFPNNKSYNRGLYLITIRVDGKLNGKDIKPVYFNGYLHIDNTSRPIFKKGDWQNDKNVLERMSHY